MIHPSLTRHQVRIEGLGCSLMAIRNENILRQALHGIWVVVLSAYVDLAHLVHTYISTYLCFQDPTEKKKEPSQEESETEEWILTDRHLRHRSKLFHLNTSTSSPVLPWRTHLVAWLGGFYYVSLCDSRCVGGKMAHWSGKRALRSLSTIDPEFPDPLPPSGGGFRDFKLGFFLTWLF